jgi:hypothetical protein
MTCTVHRLVAMTDTRVTIERAEAGACAVMRSRLRLRSRVSAFKSTRVCVSCALQQSCEVS